MADYIYLLENRLSLPQREALRSVIEIARTHSLTVFLVGGAVRDLTSGSPVRDLDIAVQGDALKLEHDLIAAGGVVAGRQPAGHALFVTMPGGVRMEVGSTLSVLYPKPGQPVATPAAILDDLRRRDFTANAMALSLNEGSYGLLMDPLNGVADIENRLLRLVSNYGFIEDPVRMIRAARLMARLGWMLEERTQTRYQTGREEGYISAMSAFQRGYELEEIFHEEDPLRVLRRLESDGWMAHLAPYWASAKVNVAELDRLRGTQTQLQMQGIHADLGAASFPLLTAKLSAKEIAGLKASFPRQDFVVEIDTLEARAKDLVAPSDAWKLLHKTPPEVVLWAAYTSKSPAVQARFKSFQTEWPQARQKISYALLQEMRIVPELAGYDELIEKLFFELMDGRLTTVEEMRAFLEPYSPPAPPPAVSAKKARAAKKDAKPAKGRQRKLVQDPLDEESEDTADQEVDADDELSEDLALAGLDGLPVLPELTEEDAQADPLDAVDPLDSLVEPAGEPDEPEDTSAVASTPAPGKAERNKPSVKASAKASTKTPAGTPKAELLTTGEDQPAARDGKTQAPSSKAGLVETKPGLDRPPAAPAEVATDAPRPAAKPAPGAKKGSAPAASPAPTAIAAKAVATAHAVKEAPIKAAAGKSAQPKPVGVKAASAKSIPAKAVDRTASAASRAAAPAKASAKTIAPAKKLAASKSVAAKTIAVKASPAKSLAKAAPAKATALRPAAKTAPAKQVPVKTSAKAPAKVAKSASAATKSSRR
jgi:tRNA nucleotidyltransferase/poly(A) polymerase